MKLDMKDLRILHELDKNAGLNRSQLAKKVGLSRQVTEYRLNKLVSQKTIYAFYPLVDVGRLGYSSFRVHIRLKNISEQTYSAFAKQLFTEYPTFWVAFISGSFDIILDIFAKNSNEFENLFAEIIKKNKEIIQDYDVFVILDMRLYPYSYFIEDKSFRHGITVHKNIDDIKLDEIDKKILQIIKYDSKVSYEKIGERLSLTRNSLTRNAIKNRIIKLEKNKIITGYKIIINFEHLGMESFKIFLKYNAAKIEQEKALLNYLTQQKGVLAVLKLLGKWNLDIEIHKKDIRELQRFIIDLRNTFEIIEDYEIVHLIEDHGIDFFPERLAVGKLFQPKTL